MVETIVGVISGNPPAEIKIFTLDTEDPDNLVSNIVLLFSITIGVGGVTYPEPPLLIPTWEIIKLSLTRNIVGNSDFGTIVVSAE